MSKFCGKCGQELDNKTKLCPQCDQTVLNKKKKRKKTVIAVIAVLCCISIISVGIFGVLKFVNNDTASYTHGDYNSFMEGFTDVLITDEKSAIEAVASIGDTLGIKDASNEFKVAFTNKRETETYYRLQQYYKGIPVFGRNITVVADESGESLGLTSNYSPIGKIDAKPSLNEEEINEIIDTEYGGVESQTNNGLIVYNLYDSSSTLAYDITVRKSDENEMICEQCIISAENGDILLKNNLIRTDITHSSDEYTYKVNDDTYLMYDESRNILILNSNKELLSYEVVEKDGVEYLAVSNDGKRNENPNPLWDKNQTLIYGDIEIEGSGKAKWKKDAVNLINGIENTYDFYSEILNWKGFDNNNTHMLSSYNDFFEKNGDNAYSIGNLLVFGYKKDLTDVGLIGHEFNHSVEGSISNMYYFGESGAIKEGYADIFGELAEDYAKDGKINNDCDWVLEQRNMVNPHDYKNAEHPYPASVEELNNAPTFTKDGKVWYCTTPDAGSDFNHFASTIISHCAYLMTSGVDGNAKIDNKALAVMWFNSLNLLHKGADFSQCRNAVELSARIMLKNKQLTEEQYKCVISAFEHAKISRATYTNKQVAKNQFTLSVLSSQKTENVSFNLTIYQRKKSNFDLFGMSFGIPYTGLYEVYNKSHTNGNVDLDLENGIYDFYITEDSSNSETIITRVVVNGQNDEATDEIVVYTDFLDITTIILNEEPTHAPSEMPSKLEFEMREEVIEFPVSDGTLYYSNTVKYPYFLGSSDIEKTINSRYAKFIEDFKNNDTDYDEVYESVKQWSSLDNLPYYDNITAEVTYNKNGAVSIKEVSTMWSGGTHPYSTVNGIIYDIKSGKALEWKDIIIGSKEAIDKKLKEALEKAVGYSVKGTMMKTLKESTGYSLCDKGLCFYYNVGDAVDRKNVILEYTSKDSYWIKLDDSTSENSKELTEKDLKAKAEEYGLVSAWGYVDYDGNGKKEAFAIITDEDMSILKTVFVSNDGNIRVMEDNLNWSLYRNNEGYIRFANDKGFFWADMGAYGSGHSTIVYSVKNESPYILKISSDIQGFYQKDDMFYTTQNEFSPEGGRAYPEYELIYDSSTQEFSVGNKIDID